MPYLRNTWYMAAWDHEVGSGQLLNRTLLGEALLFFRDTQGASGGPQLWSVDVTGYNEQQVPTPGFGSDPAWSPKLN